MTDSSVEAVDCFWNSLTRQIIAKDQPPVRVVSREQLEQFAAALPSPEREPTQRGDETAAKMRAYFEANKQDRWQEGTADNLMLGLLNIALAEYAPNRVTPRLTQRRS